MRLTTSATSLTWNLSSVSPPIEVTVTGVSCSVSFCLRAVTMMMLLVSLLSSSSASCAKTGALKPQAPMVTVELRSAANSFSV